MKDTADDDHRMRPHDIDHGVARKLPKVVGANHGVFVTIPHFIHTRLELDDVVDMRLISNRPVHATTDAAQRIFSPRVAAGQLLEHRDHAIWIETAVRKVDVRVNAELQLSALLGSREVYSDISQALEVVLTLIRINYVNRLVVTLESIFYEWEQNLIFFVGAVEKGADVTSLIE
ncbi:MAG: hypothetical protein WBQ34_04695 [Candidatus Acidiferrales bacterium]